LNIFSEDATTQCKTRIPEKVASVTSVTLDPFGGHLFEGLQVIKPAPSPKAHDRHHGPNQRDAEPNFVGQYNNPTDGNGQAPSHGTA
jgi:hypothetical protein